MPRKLWGEFLEDEPKSAVSPSEDTKFIPLGVKRMKLSEVQNSLPMEQNKVTKVRVNNPMVTQTIEVMKQTEMLQSLIDTYSNKSGTSNYLLNPCQVIPEVDFPPENVASLVNTNKFAKPIWFVPPQNSKFAKGVPQVYPQLNPQICRDALRKAVCGQLRVAGFTDTAESALILFGDATEEFLINLMQHVREIHTNNPKLQSVREIEPKSLEKAYYSMTNTSLTQVHNYFKHHLVARNRNEISEFNGVLHEYDKLMKESQNMQKEEFQEGDFVNIFEMPSTSTEEASATDIRQDFARSSSTSGGSVLQQGNILGILDNNMTLQPDIKPKIEGNTYAVDIN